MLTIDPKTIPVPKLHGYLQATIAPRPIAFVSSIDKAGKVNLSPFSFFNLFSSNPPILIFSPSRRVRDNSTKHTLQNVLEVPEVTINIVNYSMVQQASLASCEFDKGVNEFIKAGFTEIASQKVKPPRVLESPVSFECKVNEVKPLGSEGGAGNLVICEVLLIHIKDEVLNAFGGIDPYKMDAVARMGNDYYCRAQGENIFVVPKPNEKTGIGYDQLPEQVRTSSVLTGNDLGQLGNIQQLPDQKSIDEFKNLPEVELAASYGITGLHKLAQSYLREGKLEEAWRVLLS
jgi:flavin reductase (DIM6/NTAB) family NADH-FMN oxidoreductase RutF